MLVLRYAYLVALVFLLGGLLAIGGIAAPALFESLTELQGPAGRETAGLAVGAVLARFHLAGYLAIAVMGAALMAMAALGPRPVKFAVRLGILVVMGGTLAYSGLVVSPQIRATRGAIDGVVASLPEDDPRRTRFGRLHGLSTALLSVTAAGGLALLFWEARSND